MKLGFLLPAFPRKGRELDRHFVYLGEQKRLRTHNTDASALRADAALLFLRAVPEVLVMSWPVDSRILDRTLAAEEQSPNCVESR